MNETSGRRGAVLLTLLGVMVWVTNAATSPVDLGPEIDGFRVGVSLDKKEYRVGEPVRLVASIKNTARTQARVETLGGLWFYDIEISPINAVGKGKRVEVTPHGKKEKDLTNQFVSMRGIWLEPDHSLSSELRLQSLYDLSIPGRYLLNLSCQVPSRNGSRTKSVIASNEMIFTILP